MIEKIPTVPVNLNSFVCLPWDARPKTFVHDCAYVNKEMWSYSKKFGTRCRHCFIYDYV